MRGITRNVGPNISRLSNIPRQLPSNFSQNIQNTTKPSNEAQIGRSPAGRNPNGMPNSVTPSKLTQDGYISTADEYDEEEEDEEDNLPKCDDYRVWLGWAKANSALMDIFSKEQLELEQTPVSPTSDTSVNNKTKLI
ncbi:hypothetical protein IKO50_07130 [bacterium]|nr:hypothetical protein [bacterium]